MSDKKIDAAAEGDTGTEVKAKRKGVISRIWNRVFRPGDDDLENRLEYISKEEANVLKRINRRSVNVRKRVRQLIFISLSLEVIAVSYAILSTRVTDLHWKLRTIKILPMFLLPAITAILYSCFASLTRIWERKDQKLLEKLRTERQEKIDELKEKTKYYSTQQLIQRYDTDPAAKAAAATVLASKLGAESGLKVFMGEEIEKKSKEAEQAQSKGLRNRKAMNPTHEERKEVEKVDDERRSDVVVEHQGPDASVAGGDGGWIARLAALLVGEDPAHSYALICGNCRMHNGLVKKEDFPFVTYYCPHCRALNQPKSSFVGASGSTTPHLRSEVEFDVSEEPVSTSNMGIEVGASDVVDHLPPAQYEGADFVSKQVPLE